jgi:Uma2 family endonuclease
MSSQPPAKLTPEEYLAIERAAGYKSEYYDGEMFAMPGVTRRVTTRVDARGRGWG